MFLAKFEVQKQQPKVLHFEVLKNKVVPLKFSVVKKEPVRFKIDKNFNADVN